MTNQPRIKPESGQGDAVYCIACLPHYLRSDDVEFRKGDWIEIPDRGVGRFMGVWQNDIGLMFGLCYWRAFANPSERDTFWGTVGEVGAEVKPSILDTAFKVKGPLSSKGTRPARIDDMRGAA